MPIQYTQPPQPKVMRTCEICGKEVDQDYAFSLHVSWVTPGHPRLAAFNCDQEIGQHWGCSVEHAEEAIIECIQSHLHAQVLDKHQQIQDQESKQNNAIMDVGHE
jgi:hypothetical protein